MTDLVSQIKSTLEARAAEHAARFVGTDADRARYQQQLASFAGCTATEIEQLESRLDVRFPSVFRTFLEHFGRNCSDLFDGGTLETLEQYVSLRSA